MDVSFRVVSHTVAAIFTERILNALPADHRRSRAQNSQINAFDLRNQPARPVRLALYFHLRASAGNVFFYSSSVSLRQMRYSFAFNLHFCTHRSKA